MKVTLVLLVALGVVSADVGLGYHYNPPSTSYGYPSYKSAGNSGQYSQTAYSTSGVGSNYYQASNNLASGSVVKPQFELGTGFQTQYASNNLASGSVVKPQFELGTGFQTQYASSSRFQSGAANLNNYQQQYYVQQQPAQVYKHFYVHTAPEEPEPIKPRVPLVLPPPQKHYKIIFVKTPSPAIPPRVIAPIPPQQEEKTIVYVLLKKPEEQQEVVLPKTEVKPPSKPEVFFINYSDKQDSQAVINNIVQNVNAGTDGFVESGQSNVQYQIPINQGTSSGAQAFGLSSAGDASFAQSSYPVVSSTASYPVVSSTVSYPVSSTVSSINYDVASAISTSQGVPHETYGTPKFRVN